MFQYSSKSSRDYQPPPTSQHNSKSWWDYQPPPTSQHNSKSSQDYQPSLTYQHNSKSLQDYQPLPTSQHDFKSCWQIFPASQVQSTMNLQIQLLTDQHLSYTSSSGARGVYLKYHLGKWLVGATVYSDRSNKLDTAWLILRISTSAFLKQLRNVVFSSLWGVAVLPSYKVVCSVTMLRQKG